MATELLLKEIYFHGLPSLMYFLTRFRFDIHYGMFKVCGRSYQRTAERLGTSRSRVHQTIKKSFPGVSNGRQSD